MKISVKVTLRTTEEKAAPIRFMAVAAAQNENINTRKMFDGLSTVSEEIDDLVREARKALNATGLGREFRA